MQYNNGLRVTDTQGYSVYGWVKFFVPDFIKLPYSLRLQGDNCVCLNTRKSAPKEQR